MKITENRLKQIIKEELLKEGLFDSFKDETTLEDRFQAAKGEISRALVMIKNLPKYMRDSDVMYQSNLKSLRKELRNINYFLKLHDLHVSQGNMSLRGIEGFEVIYRDMKKKLLKLSKNNKEIKKMLEDLEVYDFDTMPVKNDFSPESAF